MKRFSPKGAHTVRSPMKGDQVRAALISGWRTLVYIIVINSEGARVNGFLEYRTIQVWFVNKQAYATFDSLSNYAWPMLLYFSRMATFHGVLQR